jgi:predicted Zn-dependent peptidase
MLPAAYIYSDIMVSPVFSNSLFNRLREVEGLIYTPAAVVEHGRNFGAQYFWVGTQPSKIIHIGKIIRKALAQKITRADFEIAKQMAIGRIEIEEDSNESILDNLFERESEGHGAESYLTRADEIKRATLEQVRYLSRPNRGYSTSIIAPIENLFQCIAPF